MNRRCISSCTGRCSIAAFSFPEEEPSFCAAGLPHGYSSDPCLDLIDLCLNILKDYWIYRKIWGRIGEYETRVECPWIYWNVGMSIFGIKGRFFLSPAGRSRFFCPFWLALYHSPLNSLKLQRASLRPHPWRPLWEMSHRWANMYKTDLTRRTLYN